MELNNTNRKQSLSLCLIVKNEEKSLAECLNSVGILSDETIVVDTGSTDNTVKIAESFGANIYHYEWNNDFASARNESIKYATSDWILYLDADEILSKSSAEILSDLINSAKDQDGAYICRIVSNYIDDDGKTGNYIGTYPRLFRNIGFPLLHFIGRVHEQISPSLIEQGFQLVPSDIEIFHEGYFIPQAEMQKKVERNLHWLTNHIEEEPENGYAWYQLASTLMQMNIDNQSLNAFASALKCKNLSKFLSANSALSIATILNKNSLFENVIEWCDVSLSFLPRHLPAMFLKGQTLLKLNQPFQAKKIFDEVRKILKENSKEGYLPEIPEELLRQSLNSAIMMMNK